MMNHAKHSRIMLKTVALTSAVLTLLGAAGCATKEEYPAPITLSDAMPPEVATEHASFEARLYFLSDDKRRLVEEERILTYDVALGRLPAAINALISGSESGLRRSVSRDYTLDRVELSVGACGVYLTGELPLNMEEWMFARSAIAATAYAVEGVACTDVYYNGMAVGYYGMPLGAAGVLSETLGEYVYGVVYEYERYTMETPHADGLEFSHTAALYYLDTESGLLVGRGQPLSYDGYSAQGEVAAQLIEMLAEPPEENGSTVSALPEELTLVQTPVIVPRVMGAADEGNTAEDGTPLPDETQYVARIFIEQPQSAYDEKLLCEAITLTLTGYFPNLIGVEITEQNAAGEARLLGDAAFITRESISQTLGTFVRVDVPDANGTTLRAVQHTVAQSDANSLLCRLKVLLQAPYDACFSPISASDVQDVYISDDIVVLNWKAGFSDKLLALQSSQTCTLPEESRLRLFIYSVVNTLTEIPGVHSVWMLEDGQKLGLTDGLYLGNALLRNPGLLGDS